MAFAPFMIVIYLRMQRAWILRVVLSHAVKIEKSEKSEKKGAD
ncbi:hypothetical protein ACO0K2_01595 [Undibacterium sp. MH2W]